MAGRRAALRQLVHRVIERMRHHDLMLYAAGLTFYAAIAVVPLMLLAVAGAAAIVGEGRVAVADPAGGCCRWWSWSASARSRCCRARSGWGPGRASSGSTPRSSSAGGRRRGSARRCTGPSRAAPCAVGALAWASAATGSFLAGMSLGWVLVLEIGIHVGDAFGGSRLLGTLVLVAICLFLVQVVLLVGYGLGVELEHRRDP